MRISELCQIALSTLVLVYMCMSLSTLHHHWAAIAGLDIKQFGPMAQGASRFEKLLARGPVDLRSY